MCNVLRFVPKPDRRQHPLRDDNPKTPLPQRVDPLAPDSVIAREVEAMHRLMREAQIARLKRGEK
jgi:hypothetical protein